MTINRNRFSSFLRNLPVDHLVGFSGLAVLTAASFMSFIPTDGQTVAAALGAYLSGLGSNVVAGLLHQGYQDLLSQPRADENTRLVELAEALTKDIRKDAKLRHELGNYLGSFDAFDIAQEIVSGNPSTHGWLLVQINQELVQFRNDFEVINNKLDMIQNSLNSLIGNDAPNEIKSEIPVPQNITNGSKRTIKQILWLYPEILLKTFCPTGTYISLPNVTFTSGVEIDFVIVQVWSTVTQIILVKVEDLDSRVFGQDDQFSKDTNDAIRKINTWFVWISENPLAFRSTIMKYTNTMKPQVISSLENRIKYNSVIAKAIIGRRSMLSESQRSFLIGNNLDRPKIEIVSFDRIFDTARTLYRSAEDEIAA